RRGDPDAKELLDEAVELAEGVAEAQWIVPTRGARAEHAWLSGRPGAALEDILAIYPRARGRVNAGMLGSLAVWLYRLGADEELSAAVAEPYALEIGGDPRGAASAWRHMGRSYDAALVDLLSSRESAIRDALVVFDELGATAAA